ncbi:hypothetical protein V8C37DRAFT_400101 [Trichoderma ceciliae]
MGTTTNIIPTLSKETSDNPYDILIAGSGPIGAVFAQKLRKAEKRVLMIDVGEQATRRFGDHKKNSTVIQKDISRFTNIVKGDLHLLSVPVEKVSPNLEPYSCAGSVQHVVGGMGAHWTCCTPRQHEQELSTLFTDTEWDKLYKEAEGLFRTNNITFDDSIRQQLIQHELKEIYTSRGIQSMPLACERRGNYVEWSTCQVEDDPYNLCWKKQVEEHRSHFPADPLPFLFRDPDPQSYFPYTDKHPWHGQVHRDAFGYSEIPPTIDQRLVVDFRWFTYVKPHKDNRVTFSSGLTDTLGMPQPTFCFTVNNKEDEDRCANMISDMIDIARRLGGFLPGAEPRYLPMGSALHICGTYRAGESVKDSVVDRHGKVWGHDNLVLGGCGVIPTGNACNPTLTAACFAIAAVDQMIKEF